MSERALRSTPRRYGAGALALVAVVSAAGAFVLGRSGGGGGPAAAPISARERYQCPMHPSIVQDHPGECPICGMALVAVDPGHAERKISFYRSPMDPKVTSPAPAKDPMGMDYLPVYADEAPAGASVAGRTTIDIDPARQQLIGLRTAPVTAGPVGGAWRTVGRVAVDETRVRHINLKVPGFVERVFVDFIGKTVKRGTPLFTLYSPELLAAQEEYLLALRTRGALGGGSGGPGGMGRDGDVLVKAARRKLALWDIPDGELDRLAASGTPTKTMTFFSPVAGVVTKKDVVDGMRLEAGAMPYEIVDLTTVWVLADVYEDEVRFITEGMPATLTLNAFPDQHFDGKVLFMDPMLDPRTRTIKVRLAFPNPDGALRPEMYGEAVLHGTPREGLRIPEDAVIDSGTEKIVFVALGAGKFQPRIVRLGESSGPDVEVVAGLTGGERVVTRANFLIDSESQLRASLAGLRDQAAAVAPAPAAMVVDGDDAASEAPRDAGRDAGPAAAGGAAGR